MDDTKTVLRGKGRWRRPVLESAIFLAVTALLEWFFFGFCHVDFSTPITSEGDGLSALLLVKNILRGSDALKGFPFAQDLSAFQANYTELSRLFIKTCGLFVHDPGTVMDLWLFAIPLFNAFVCYWVLRHFKVRSWLAGAAAITYGFCPYVQWRLSVHMHLATIECIPLVLLVILWCMEDPAFNRPGKGWARNRRNWIGLFFAWMFANNGMVYYPFFSCFLLCVTALCLWLREKTWKAIVPPVIMIGEIAAFLALGFVPTVIGALLGYGNVAALGSARSLGEATIYSMRLNSLLVSPKGWGSPFLRQFTDSFLMYCRSTDPLFFNENAYAYIGIVATLGFLILFVCLFLSCSKKENSSLKSRLWMLAHIMAAAILLGVQSGLGTLVNFFVRYIRGYNRISPYICCCGIFAVALCAEAFLSRLSAANKMRCSVLSTAALLLVFGYGLWEQQGIYLYFEPGYADEQRQWNDANVAFVHAIEEQTAQGDIIFQLPYMKSFENGITGNIPDYDHLRGLLYSDTLRWCYGAPVGSENDLWYQRTAAMDPWHMVSELAAQGIAGIWLNKDGYEEAEGNRLEQELCAAAHCAGPLRCEDGHTVYIPLRQLVYDVDPLTEQVRGMYFTATEGDPLRLREELAGSETAFQWVEDAFAAQPLDGEYHYLPFPDGQGFDLHWKTPEERGELVSVATLVDENNAELQPNADHLLVFFPMSIEKDTLYKITVELPEDADFDDLKDLVVDFWAPGGYDRPEQEAANFVLDGRYTYTFYFDSGEFAGESLDGYARAFVYGAGGPVTLKNYRVEQMVDTTEDTTQNEMAG